MHCVAINKIDSRYMVSAQRFSTLFHNTPPRPGLFLSAEPEFLKRGEFFQQFFQRGRSRKLPEGPDYHTATGLSMRLEMRKKDSQPDL